MEREHISSLTRIANKEVLVQRKEKTKVVEQLNAAWSGNIAGVLTHYCGLSVAEISDLRRKLHQENASFQVVKNSLAKRAIEGTGFAAAEDLFTGPTAVAYGMDPVAVARVVSEFAKKNETLKIRGGVLDGKAIDISAVAALASLPGREVLLAKLLGSLQAPVNRFVRTLAEVPASFVRTLAAIRDQKEAA